jgi:hypothetical protein
MLAFVISLNIFILAILLAAAFSIGYLIRAHQISEHRKKILELEKDMLNCHAEILELEKEKSHLIHQMKESKIPVIPLQRPKDDNNRKAN